MNTRNLTELYNGYKKTFLSECAECGQCVEHCRVVPFLDRSVDAGSVIGGLRRFLAGGEAGEETKLLADACMRCYGCTGDYCPIGMDKLLLNELYWRENELRTQEKPYSRKQYVFHEERMRRFTSPEEYRRITEPKIVKGAEFVLFPGCNIYRQPEKVLDMLDLMDAVGIPYSFLPGISYCCGQGNRGSRGDTDWSQEAGEKLSGKCLETGARTIVFWCPTCMCHVKYCMERYFPEGLPLRHISFARYLNDHIDKLSFPMAKPQKLTLHEPCKTAYLGIDLEEVRRLLLSVPGTELVEMEHHHENTVCCACRAANSLPETGDRITAARFAEAEATGADKMIDVCHNCHWVFMNYENAGHHTGIGTENYVTFLADACGIHREDTMKIPLDRQD